MYIETNLNILGLNSFFLCRKSNIILFQVKFDCVIDLFKTVPSIILFSISHSQALILLGNLHGPPLMYLMDVKAVNQPLRPV